MWDLAVREDDFKAAETMVQRYPKAPLSFRIPLALAQRDTAAFDRLREEVRNLHARQAQIAGRYVATHLEDFAVGEELARMDLATGRSAASRLSAQTFLAWLEVARGRWSTATAAFDSASRMEGGEVVLTDRAIAATLPFLPVSTADLDAIRRALESWDPQSGESPAVTTLGGALRPYLRLYLLGLVSSRLGDDARALTYAQELERSPQREHVRSVVTGFAAIVRADVAQRRARYADALKLLQSANGEVPLELVYVRPFVNVREYTQEHARYLRIEALLALGRIDEARGWLATSFQGSPSELVYLAPMHEKLAGIHAQRGERDQALTHYRAFAALWRESDPPLQLRVKDAITAATRLEAR